jgi:hypothetical protein
MGSMMKLWREFCKRDVVTPVFAYETGVTSTPNGAIKPFSVQEKGARLAHNFRRNRFEGREASHTSGQDNNCPLMDLGWESPAYLLDLQGHFLFLTHTPGYIHLPLFGLGDQRGFYSQLGSLEIS